LPVIIIALSSVLTSVNAHGYVQEVQIDGKQYSGWLPWVDPYAEPVPTRIVRKVPGDGPILDNTSKDLACNQGGETGTKMVADINAGSKITFQWNTWPADHLGPVSVYMASCNGECSSFNTANAKWFKIDEKGYTNKVWASQNLIANNNSWTATIPSELAAGQYLVRNEIVALHNANQPQYYPSCTQLNVKGSGSSKPASSELVSIPGVYKGFTWPDIWSDSFSKFSIPGPNVVSFASGGSGNSVTPSSSSVSTKPSSSSLSKPPSSVISSSASSPIPSSSGVPSCSGKRSERRSLADGSKRYSRHANRGAHKRRSH